MDNSEESFESSLSKRNLDNDLLDEFDDADTGSLSEFHDIIDFEYYPEDIDSILDDDLASSQNDNVLNFNLSSLDEEIGEESFSDKPIKLNLSSFVDKTDLNILEDEVDQTSSMLDDSDNESISLSPLELGNITEELDSNILDDDDSSLLVPDELEQAEANLDDEQISLDSSELDHILNADETDEEESEESIFVENDLQEKSSLVGAEEHYDDFEEGEISLSANELVNILGSDSELETSEDEDDSDSGEHKSFFDDFDEEENENLDSTDEDESIALSPDELGNITATETEEVGSVFAEDGDEEIALSGDELNNLLDTNDIPIEEDLTGSTFGESSDEDESIALSPDELGNITATETEEVDSVFAEDGDEEIALSGDELNNLLDTSDLQIEEVGSEDDEPITLSSEEDLELKDFSTENIEPIDEDEIALSGNELDHLLESDGESDQSEQPTSFFETVEEDESIALTGDELGNITAEPASEEEDISLSSDELSNILDDNNSDDSITDYLAANSEDDAIDEFNYEHDESSTENQIGFDSDETLSLSNDDTDSNISLSTNELNNILEDDSAELGISEDDFIIDDGHSSISTLDSVDEDQPTSEEENYQAKLKNVNKDELKKLMSHMDELLGSLPDSYIKEFATSEYFELYKKIMEELEL